MPKNTALLLKLWLQNPRKIGAIVPSSPNLAKAMAKCLPESGTGYVVELGGGTGPVTRALLEGGLEPERLIVIERDKHLHNLLSGQYPQIKILQGDAIHLKKLLHQHGIDKVSAIVSSLPLLAMSKQIRHRIGDECFSVLSPGAPLIQFTYGFLPPLRKHNCNIVAMKEKSILRNIPPATVWTYRQSS